MNIFSKEVLTFASIAILFSSASYANSCRDIPASLLSSGSLYVSVAKKGCKNLKCYQKVKEESDLKNGDEYITLKSNRLKFVFGTNQGPKQNSIIVIHARHGRIQPQNTNVKLGADDFDASLSKKKIALERERIKFACDRRGNIVSLDEVRRVREQKTDGRLNLDEYDDYHRYKITGSSDGRFLNDRFHFSYNNDKDCGSRTNDNLSRRHFLTHNFKDYRESRVARFFSRLGRGSIAYAGAELEILEFSEINVKVQGYSRVNQKYSCISFDLDVVGDFVQLNIIDLEDKRRMPMRERRKDRRLWTIMIE